MPHINRIRVNNVKYNFGTQYYDDFVMRFDGRNVLYDLANGGGKSVLLLLLLQNLIPNCTLDEKQPIEKLFRGDNGSTVIHSLIEWQLDDYLIKDDYKYMLTGFCARKAKNDENQHRAAGDVAAIEYFNYVIFYRHYNENDIINLPLANGKERVTFPGLKNYIKNLGRKDFNLQVHIFERKGEYQQFIAKYGLYESEWEIIKGINKTEGHVRAYFEGRYRTTRKVVEDLLIEEIIQSAFVMRTMKQTAADTESAASADTALMADTLYQIKDQLAELTRKKAEITQYDRQTEVLNSLGERIRTLDEVYNHDKNLKFEMAKTWQTLLAKSRELSIALSTESKNKENMRQKIADLSRQIETAKIQSNRERLAELTQEAENCRNQIVQTEDALLHVRDDLNMRQSMNDYLEYREEQHKYQAIVETVHHAASGQQEQLAALQNYAAEWGTRYKKRCRELDSRLLADKQAMHSHQAELGQAQESLREADRMLAVLEHQLQTDHATEKQLVQTFNTLRDQSGLLIIEDIDRAIRTCMQQTAQAERQLGLVSDEKLQAERELQRLSIQLENSVPEAARLQETIRQLTDFVANWQAGRERLEKLFTVYHVQDMDSLHSHLFDRYRKLIYELELKQQQKLSAEKYLQQLTEQNPLDLPEDTKQLMAYIRTCHGVTCTYGADYLKALTQAEKEDLLKRLPFIPYAVIVQDGFSKLAGDLLLQEKDFGSHLIPMIGLETVLSDQVLMDQEHLLFAGKGQQFFLDDVLIEKEKLHCQESLQQLTQQLARMTDQLQTYEQDMEDVSAFQLMYDRQKTARQNELHAAEASLEALKAQCETDKLSQQTLKVQIENNEKQAAKQTNELNNLKKQAETLNALQSTHETMSKLRGQIAEEEQHRTKTAEEKHHQEALLTKIEAENAVLVSRCQVTEAQKEAYEREWQDEWQVYALTDVTPDAALQVMDDAQLKAAFSGAKEAYEREHMDLADKQQLMESYGRSMERLQKAIADRSHVMAQLAESYEAGGVYVTADDVIQTMRTKLGQLEAEKAAGQKRLTTFEAERNQLYGSVSQAVTVVEEKYGAYKEVDLNEQSYDRYIETMTQYLGEVTEKFNTTSKHIDKMTRETYLYEGLRRDLERMMTTYRVPADLTKDIYTEQVNLRQKYETLTRQQEHLQMQRMAKREAFEKDKAKTVSQLAQLGASSLAAEIDEHVTLPENAEAVAQMLHSIEETIQLIDLEKQRIASNMEGLLTIKTNFENQCLQICQNIKTELDKLPKMSDVSIDGEQIQMLGLQIPYIKETFYQEQMAAYIDEIVTTADAMNSQDEKMRYIRKQLAWKRLFSVIVSDMNAIRLTLYKRERIKEQSRYLKYEEAVGSTGQSQGIYIQFLIAIIHYISCIHAGASSGEKLKKVIFIDNPFGAAKDIYIWEPIFALLATNDVQLIVPARGATPAISGKFDVNYVLGQKLLGNKQQTIVVDYHSNIVIEEMEYVKIDYEQEVFDFV